jgi:hypothetical protein
MRIAIFIILSLAAPAMAGEICFPAGQSSRLLEEVESCREELPLLRDLTAKGNDLAGIQAGRIVELEKERDTLLKMNEQARQAADDARKANTGSWWEQALKAGKWIGLGVLVGFAAGAAR